MLRTRGQQRRATVKVGGWAELPDELLAKVLELLQVAGQAGGLGFSQVATVRLVCAGWKAVHDALVTRLVLRRQTTDEAMGMLVLRFPAVASQEVKVRYKLVRLWVGSSAGPHSPSLPHSSTLSQLPRPLALTTSPSRSLQITRLTDCECVEPIIVSLTAPDADLADFDGAQFTSAAAAALQVTPDQLLVRATVFCLM